MTLTNYAMVLLMSFEPAKTVIEKYQIRLITYNPFGEVIEEWIE